MRSLSALAICQDGCEHCRALLACRSAVAVGLAELNSLVCLKHLFSECAMRTMQVQCSNGCYLLFMCSCDRLRKASHKKNHHWSIATQNMSHKVTFDSDNNSWEWIRKETANHEWQAAKSITSSFLLGLLETNFLMQTITIYNPNELPENWFAMQWFLIQWHAAQLSGGSLLAEASSNFQSSFGLKLWLASFCQPPLFLD